jgi:hypothetical protein
MHGESNIKFSYTGVQKMYKYTRTLFINCTQKHCCSGSIHKHSVVQKVYTNTLDCHLVNNRDCKQNAIQSNNDNNKINSSVTLLHALKEYYSITCL